MMRIIFNLIVASNLLIGSPAVAAELVVVANVNSGVLELKKQDVINIYMGRFQKLPSGLIAFPVDLGEERDRFYSLLVNKTPPEVRSYWARLVFTGQASPPRLLKNTNEVIEMVSNNKGAVGYIERRYADERVKVVYTINE